MKISKPLITLTVALGLFFSFSSVQALTPLEIKGVKTIPSATIDTDPPSWTRKIDATDIKSWLEILPRHEDRNHDEYIVIPGLGIVVPVIYTPTTDPRYEDIVKGRNLDVNEFLKKGVHHYPGTSLPGQEGNSLIGGHSNFFKNQKTDFTSIFATLPMLDPEDEVWYYKRITPESWMKYIYTVTKSYETKPDDATVFDPIGTGSELTFYTCVPIGTADNRWIVRTKLISQQQLFYPHITQSYENWIAGQDLDESAKEQLRSLISSGATDEQIQQFIDSGVVPVIESGSMSGSDTVQDVVVQQIVQQTEKQQPWRKRLIERFIGLFS